ncbi:MAG: polymerase, sigma-24 subunit, subfamily [Ilumatobacteraceae bacterium]|nr:polymerase, sigma-24 subunit, subfamily [Ilumatobacteraceae bacterium]
MSDMAAPAEGRRTEPPGDLGRSRVRGRVGGHGLDVGLGLGPGVDLDPGPAVGLEVEIGVDPVIDRGMRVGPTTVAAVMHFDDLYRSQFERMVRLAHVLVDTQEEAEEVVQDAFATVLTRFARIDHPEAYLRRCVLNGARQVLRRRRIVRRQPVPPVESSSLAFNHVLDAVRRLPHRQRAAIVLRYEMQLSDAEIAQSLRVPIGTVKSTLHRAVARLRLEVEP